MTSIAVLLARLDRVRQTGTGRWIAKCPAHDDRSPSLSLRETEDKILVKCHAGCGVGQVLDAINLTLLDLFLDQPKESKGRRYQPDSKGLLLMLSREAWVIYCAANDMIEGKPFSTDDFNRLVQALQRMNRILEIAGVRA